MYFRRKTVDCFRPNFSSIQTLILRFGYLCWHQRIVLKMADNEGAAGEENFHSSGKQRSSIMFLHHRSVLPGLIQCDILVVLWTLLLENIFILGRPQFELRAKKRDHLFCLAQRSSPMVKLLVKVADMALNRRETCVIFVFELPRKTRAENAVG